MMENTVSLETLKVENYSMESGLTSVNRRTVDKMFHYIHSFPLDEYDVELIRKDIIGMAMEGEQRNEPLHMMTVSYTHLDVYKRQVLFLSPDSQPDFGLAGRIVGSRHDLSLFHILQSQYARHNLCRAGHRLCLVLILAK